MKSSFDATLVMWVLQMKKAEEPDMNKKQQRLQKHLKKAMKKSVLSPGVRSIFVDQKSLKLKEINRK